MLLTLAAAHGLAWLMRSIVIDGRWLGLAEERFRPGPGGLGRWPWSRCSPCLTPRTVGPAQGSFAAYRDAGSWLAEVEGHGDGKVLDMTDWSLFFSGQPGFRLLSDVHWAAIDPEHPLGRRSRRPHPRPLALQPICPRPDRRPEAGRRVSRTPRAAARSRSGSTTAAPQPHRRRGRDPIAGTAAR